jgi:hypothetical protein
MGANSREKSRESNPKEKGKGKKHWSTTWACPGLVDTGI